MEPNRGDVRTPDVMHPRDWHAASHGGGHPRRGMRLTQPGLGIPRLSAQRVQPPRPPFVMHRVPLTPPPSGHPTHAIVRRVGVLLLQHRPQREMLCTRPMRLVVVG